MASSFVKDPNAVLDYVFDWSAYLDTGETISSYTITVQTGITKNSDSQAAGKVTVWMSGGTDGTMYSVACRIVTSAGRTDERTMFINCMST